MNNQIVSATRSPRAALLFLLVAGVAGCGGGGGGGGAPPAAPMPEEVIISYDFALSAGDVISKSDSAGTGAGTLRWNRTRGEFDVTLTLENVEADRVTLREGIAGVRGVERFELMRGSAAGEWRLHPSAASSRDTDALAGGRLHVHVSSAAAPDGALRGQVLPAGLRAERVSLNSRQVVAGSEASGDARVWVTLDDAMGTVEVHAVVAGIDDADGLALRQAIAGRQGGLLAALTQDAADPDHWFLEEQSFDGAWQTAFAAAELYFHLTSTTAAEGALRGQWLPAGAELVVTDVRSDGVVLAAPSVRYKAGYAQLAGRLMTTLHRDMLHSHANLFAMPGADRVELRRAPHGQNGPLVASFARENGSSTGWSLDAMAIDPVLDASLTNRGIYLHVTTPAAPGGAARGQLITAASTSPADSGAFVVAAMEPPNAARLTALPETVSATLNRAPLAVSVTPAAVRVVGSGGDGSFGDGNEVALTPASVSASDSGIVISLAGVQASDDVYRVELDGDGAEGIVDQQGIALDGDGDGRPGGMHTSAFELAEPEVTVTLSELQQTIFTPTCAGSGCHSGSNPPDGLHLTAGNTYSNTVNRASVQQPQLMRIRPGDPDASYLVRKIEGQGIVANRMPLGGEPLSEEQIAKVRQWVIEGAQDN